MHRVRILPLAAGAMIAAACSETSSPNNLFDLSDSSAFSSVPTGFSQLSSSFDSTGSPGDGPFRPHFEGRRGHGPGGPGGGPGFGLGFMGGGLGGLFFGGDLFHFRGDGNCAFSSSTGLVTCTGNTRDGLTVTRVSSYKNAAGQAQEKIDSTTNTIATTTTVKGTATRRDSSTSVVDETSSQTVTGLAKGSTQRTINGASAGSESTTGKSDQGAFTSKRVAGDTVTNVVIPVSTSSGPSYPTSGTVVRSISVTVTLSGQAATTHSRREVVTYDGSATAKVVITQDGTTQNCTLPLPHGRLTCQ
ncbi:MAG TPA: hypothetical protein VGP95_19675 [Gemmatimonadaceae bacterium]|jgi:hypothetical protein|nr:hypothetical protein [Gemmatimonadaceae bacterium]